VLPKKLLVDGKSYVKKNGALLLPVIALIIFLLFSVNFSDNFSGMYYFTRFSTCANWHRGYSPVWEVVIKYTIKN